MEDKNMQAQNFVSNNSHIEANNIENKEEENKNVKNKEKYKITSLTLIRFKWLVIGLILGIALSIFSYLKIKNSINIGVKIESTKLNIDYLTGTIHNMSDLITSELEYTGLVEFKTNEDKWNRMFTAEKFLMVYNAQIKAGIDLSSVKLTSEDEKIIVKMPHSTVKFKKVNPNSIRIYDVKKAFIKGDGKMQLKEAIVEAENDMEKNANLSKLLKSAEDQAEAIIKGLINEIENKEVEFCYETSIIKRIGTKSSVY